MTYLEEFRAKLRTAKAQREQARAERPWLYDQDLWNRRYPSLAFTDTAACVPEDDEPVKRRKRKPTLAGIAKQTAKACIPVAAYEVRSDGTIRIIVGAPGEAKPGDDGWRDVVLL
jgi:hypothetical protein